MVGAKWFLVAPVLSFFVGAAGTKATTAKSACALANEWVAANASALPRTYAAFQTQERHYRAAIYAKLPVADRISLWTEHLHGYLKPEAGLSAEQRAFVREVIVRLPVFIDDDVEDGAFTGAARTESAQRLFGDSAAATMFFSLVANAEASGGNAAPFADCNCGGDYSCSPSSATCNNMSGCPGNSCGFLGCHYCTGTCNGAEE
jgi:hypothetical protein